MSRPKSLLLVVLVLVAAALGWTGWRAFQVKGDLGDAERRAEVVARDLARGDAAAARRGIPGVQVLADRAADRSSDPVWQVAERLPFLGASLRTGSAAAKAVQILSSRALPEAVTTVELLHRDRPVRASRVDLDALARLEVHVAAAAQATAQARSLLEPRRSFLPSAVAEPLERARARLATLGSALAAGQKALQLAPPMLGRDGPRRYFVAVQNNAESRATGGLIGAFAIVTADRGLVRLQATGTDTELKRATMPVASDPQAAQTWQRTGSTVVWYAANLTPHFPDAASNIALQWTAQSQQTIDGVIALDPVTMSELLRATGPVQLPDGFEVTAANVSDFVGHTEYVRYPDVPRRKKLLATLAGDLFRGVVNAKDSAKTLQSMARAASSGHLMVWSARPQEQARLGQGLVGGALPVSNTPYLSVLTQNFSGDKLDFYLRRRIRVRPVRKGVIEVAVTLRNTAPLGLPLYMTVRSDAPAVPVPYGQDAVGLSFYGALTSQILSVVKDGRPTVLQFDRDHGHLFGTMAVEVPRGKPVTVKVIMTGPAGELVYRQQPLVVPDELVIDVPHRVVGR